MSGKLKNILHYNNSNHNVTSEVDLSKQLIIIYHNTLFEVWTWTDCTHRKEKENKLCRACESTFNIYY